MRACIGNIAFGSVCQIDEVHRSNMSKLDEDGKPIYREDGKVMKGPNYFKPDLSKFVNQISSLKSIAGAL